MIISHEHRFVFVELPRTGSTAVGKELIESYGGVRILRKHSSYGDFVRQATPDERTYFKFSSIRNPMDDAVSGYFKLATDHHGRYSDEMRRRYRVGNRGADTMRANGVNAKGLKPQRRKISERRTIGATTTSRQRLRLRSLLPPVLPRSVRHLVTNDPPRDGSHNPVRAPRIRFRGSPVAGRARSRTPLAGA